tara:strand:- start:607 stop:1668 length:1062 start_codon:yes stop_codon:yes gene_type:complete
MDGILLSKKIGIIGGGISGLVVGIFLAKEGHQVSIFEKKSLLSETSSKTTKLLHGGLRYLENFHIKEVQKGLNDRHWWLKNFPQHTNKIKILIPFKNVFSLELLKFYIGIKFYGFLAGKKKLGKSKLSIRKVFRDTNLDSNFKGHLSFFDGVMDDELLGKDLIRLAKELKINLYENNEVSNFDIYGNIDNKKFDKVILAVGPWTKILLKRNKIKSLKDIDYIKGSHLILNKKINSGLMFKGVCQSRYVFALPYKEFTLLGTTEVKVKLPDNPQIDTSEENYLIDSVNKAFRDPVTNKDIISAYSGVRPLIRSRNNFNKSSRDFFIQQDSNLISIFGGKWTTSPSIARKIATIV